MRRRKSIAGSVCVLVLALLAAGSPAGATQPECQVVNLAPKKVTYTSNAYADPLGTAIAAAESGDTLQLIGTCHGSHLITKDLTITGRSSDQHNDTLVGDASDAVLSGRTIASDVRVHLTVRDVTITGGAVGIGVNRVVLDVANTHVIGNAGTGISNGGSSTVNIENTVVSGNHSSSLGGGIHNSIGAGEMTISNSTISGNTTTGNGGGVTNRGRLTLLNSVIEGNIASGNGGGIWVLSGTVNITDSTVTGNTATLGGAAFVNTGGTVTVTGASNLCGNTPDDWPGCTA